MKKEQQIIFKLDEELFELFKIYCIKNRTTMSAKLREYIIKELKLKED